jgi:hypothetical protein
MIQHVVTTTLVAALSAALLLLAKRRRVKRHLDRLPLLQLGPNRLGVSAVISPVGASIVKLIVPAADGTTIDVVLGYERASSYAVGPNQLGWGAVVGAGLGRRRHRGTATARAAAAAARTLGARQPAQAPVGPQHTVMRRHRFRTVTTLHACGGASMTVQSAPPITLPPITLDPAPRQLSAPPPSCWRVTHTLARSSAAAPIALQRQDTPPPRTPPPAPSRGTGHAPPARAVRGARALTRSWPRPQCCRPSSAFAAALSARAVPRRALETSQGRFVLDGEEYHLAVNNGPNALHGQRPLTHTHTHTPSQAPATASAPAQRSPAADALRDPARAAQSAGCARAPPASASPRRPQLAAAAGAAARTSSPQRDSPALDPLALGKLS